MLSQIRPLFPLSHLPKFSQRIVVIFHNGCTRVSLANWCVVFSPWFGSNYNSRGFFEIFASTFVPKFISVSTVSVVAIFQFSKNWNFLWGRWWMYLDGTLLTRQPAFHLKHYLLLLHFLKSACGTLCITVFALVYSVVGILMCGPETGTVHTGSNSCILWLRSRN